MKLSEVFRSDGRVKEGTVLKTQFVYESGAEGGCIYSIWGGTRLERFAEQTKEGGLSVFSRIGDRVEWIEIPMPREVPVLLSPWSESWDEMARRGERAESTLENGVERGVSKKGKEAPERIGDKKC